MKSAKTAQLVKLRAHPSVCMFFRTYELLHGQVSNVISGRVVMCVCPEEFLSFILRFFHFYAQLHITTFA
jgi:hypothetical protein